MPPLLFRHAPHGACELKYSTFERKWKKYKSRSPRSVWVEIFNHLFRRLFLFCHAPHGACELKSCIAFLLCDMLHSVTLPTERVSWNRQFIFSHMVWCESRSPRSVWVEIIIFCFAIFICDVTLPTERVSWNFWRLLVRRYMPCHAPHGACELKFSIRFFSYFSTVSRSPRSVWVEMTLLNKFGYTL